MKYKVRDGYVEKCDEFWWLCEDGPVKVEARNWLDHLLNLRYHPEAYQIKEPVFKRITEGVDEGLCVYEHEDRYKLLEQGKPISKKSKVKRKRPEFTFEDGVDLAREAWNHAGALVMVLRYPNACTDKDRLKATQEYLRSTIFYDGYEYKPLRKKLKLYIKWLQSEMGKLKSSK